MNTVTIIGLGYIGSSIGFALRTKYGSKIKITGYDSDQSAQNNAKKVGAVTHTAWNLSNAVKDAELVIVSTPPGVIEEIFASIAGHIDPSCVVTDTAVTKRKIVEWAENHLPGQFVGGNPLVGGLQGNNEEPSGYIFSSASWALVTPKKTPSRVIKKVTDLLDDLGANPFFLDPVEHDSFTAATVGLPTILSATLMNIISQSPSWHEMSKFSGPNLDMVTKPAASDPAISIGSISTNNDMLIDWINRSIDSLISIKSQLLPERMTDDNEPLINVFVQAWEERARLDIGVADRRKNTQDRPEIPTASEGMMSIFFGNRFARIIGGSNKKKDKNKVEYDRKRLR